MLGTAMPRKKIRSQKNKPSIKLRTCGFCGRSVPYAEINNKYCSHCSAQRRQAAAQHFGNKKYIIHEGYIISVDEEE